MRILTTILAATLLASPLIPGVQAKEVSVEFFYDSLDPYGDWLQTKDYGYVWHPKEVSEDWRPYTDGSWAYTDAGWTWVSEEPYGAITYHYGRWTRLQDVGWIWVPDTEWAPAWVSWRRSEQYVGWAPLPPEATFKREVGISSWSDSYYDIGPEQYSFVAVREFGAPRLAKFVLPRKENVTVIRETRNITNITYTSGGIYNDGPEYTVISRESREPVRRLRLERRDDVVFEGNRVRGDGMRATIDGDALRVFAPAVGFRSELAPHRVSRQVDRVEIDRGWRGVPQAQDLRARFQQDTPRAPAALPQQPAFTRATTALGLSDNASRKANLDADGKPRAERAGRSTDQPRTSATTENTAPGSRTGAERNGPGSRPQPGAAPEPGAPRTAREGDANAPRNGKGKPNVSAPGREGVKPSAGSPENREGKPGAPRISREGGPDAGAPGREGNKPAPGAPENREGKPGAPRTSREGGPDAGAPGREGNKPATGAPENREGKPAAPRTSREGGPDAGAPGREGDKPATGALENRDGKPGAPRTSRESGPNIGAPGREGAKPETNRPDSPRAGAEREPKASAPARPDAPRPETERPSNNRPGADRKEPGIATQGPDRPRKEGGAPEGGRRPEGAPATRENAAPAGRPGAPAGAAARKGDDKKGDDKKKDEDKGR